MITNDLPLYVTLLMAGTFLFFFLEAVFGKNKKDIPVDEIKFIEDPFKNMVKCERCRCYLDRGEGHKVEQVSLFGTRTLYYCPVHKKPYEEVKYEYPHTIGEPHQIRFFKKIEIDENGEPLGYKKVATEKK